MHFKGIFSKRKTGITFAVLILFSVISLFISTQKPVFRPKEIGLSVVSVFQHAFFQAGEFFSKTISSVKELGELKAEYDAVVQKLEDYEALQSDIIELRKENKQLKEILGFSETMEYSNIPARIIGKDPGNMISTIVLNKGRKHGIKRNMPVISVQDGSSEKEDGIRHFSLVGKILEVGFASSLVQPLFNRDAYVAARLQRTRYEGLVSGSGINESRVIMRYVSEEARNYIRHGDLVITSGFNSIYPKGIHIGFVNKIQGKSYENSLELTIEPVVDFSRMEYVFILNHEDPETK